MKRHISYFAAANSYDGFVNFFPDILKTEELTKLWILKGGPGTGKSTLMKRAEQAIGKIADATEVYLCSSDPKSYDGVLFQFGNDKIAIMDGTAPHARDPELPGAVDAILSLGEGWNEKQLQEARPTLLNLKAKKTAAYALAYRNLSIIGDIERKRRAESIIQTSIEEKFGIRQNGFMMKNCPVRFSVNERFASFLPSLPPVIKRFRRFPRLDFGVLHSKKQGKTQSAF